MAKRPAEMAWNGRRVDQVFPPSEELYRAFPPGSFLPNGRINLARLEFPDISMNRSKLGGKPEYARWAHDDGLFLLWGVWRIFVEHIPDRIVRIQDVWTFEPCHTPQDLNYYHCDLRAYLNSDHQGEGSEVDDEVQLLFRFKLQNKVRQVLRPIMEAET